MSNSVLIVSRNILNLVKSFIFKSLCPGNLLAVIGGASLLRIVLGGVYIIISVAGICNIVLADAGIIIVIHTD